MKITDDMLTEWFTGDVKPVHEGVYPTLWRGMLGFARYGSGGWGHSYFDFEIACRLSSGPDYPSDYQDKQWRGLTEKHHGRNISASIRALKTAPTSNKGGAC